MATQRSNSYQIDYPVYKPNKAKNRARSSSHSSDFNLGQYSVVPTQVLSKRSSVSTLTSIGHAIKQVSDHLLRNHPSALSRHQRPPTTGHMSPRVSRQKHKRTEGVRIRKLIHVKSTKFENRSKGLPSEAMQVEDMSPVNNEHITNENLTRKYQPRVFTDITGHEITVMAISKAIEKKKIASLYLFHGPTGTGKTSTARIFAMALNCESTSSPKPCWSCGGCLRSLFIMDLCSGHRSDGFEKIKTLLESTSFARAVPGFKVLIIKQCHLFKEEDWDELLGMAGRAYTFGVIFVIVTVAANMVPLNILSRCQKFCFRRLTNMEIMLKLAKIAANEGIRIEQEPLKMIAAKAEGSLREAENLLDQLALLGSSITSSMVQQLVGLLPLNKLLDLLEIAISGNSIKTIRCTKELIATGVEPQQLVSQLAGLITDILSDDAGSASSSSSTGLSNHNVLLRQVHQLQNTQSERFCHVLKVLVETEKQLRCSTDQNIILMAALLDITSNDLSDRISAGHTWPKKESPGDKSTVTSEDQHHQSIFQCRSNSHSESISSSSEHLDTEMNKLFMINGISKKHNPGIPKDVKTILPNMNDMEEIWQKTLTGIQKGCVKEFLLQAKLASLTVSSGNIIVHLMFKKPEDKMVAQMSEITIRRVLQSTIGCDVILNMSIEPAETGITKNDAILTKSQSYIHSEPQPEVPYLAEVFNTLSFEDACNRTQWQSQNIYTMQKKVANTHPRNISPFLGPTMQKDDFDASINTLRETLAREQAPNEPKHRCLSTSSLEQSDASVEPYSQDILFDRADEDRRGNGRKNRRFRRGFLNNVESVDFPNRIMNQRRNYFWGCSDVLCSRQTQ